MTEAAATDDGGEAWAEHKGEDWGQSNPDPSLNIKSYLHFQNFLI